MPKREQDEQARLGKIQAAKYKRALERDPRLAASIPKGEPEVSAAPRDRRASASIDSFWVDFTPPERRRKQPKVNQKSQALAAELQRRLEDTSQRAQCRRMSALMPDVLRADKARHAHTKKLEQVKGMNAARRAQSATYNPKLRRSIFDLKEKRPKLSALAIAKALKGEGATEKIVRNVLESRTRAPSRPKRRKSALSTR